MSNKQAKYNDIVRSYLACRGILRIKQAADYDYISEAEKHFSDMAPDILANRYYDKLAKDVRKGGVREGSRHGKLLRRAGTNFRDAEESIGNAISKANGRVGKGSLEGIGSNAGDWLGRNARDFGENVKALAGAGGAYLNRVGKGAWAGAKDAWQGAKGIAGGLRTAGNKLYNYADNSIGDFIRGFGDNPGASALGLATGAGLGYLGHRAGENIANYFGIDKDNWKSKALRWGLAGLSGLGGFYLGRGVGKGFGNGFKNGKPDKSFVNPRDEVSFNPKSIRMSQEELLQKQKAEQEADAAKSGRSGSYGTLKYDKPVQVRQIPGGEENRNIGQIAPRSDAYGKSKKK